MNIMYLYGSKGFGGMVRNLSLLINRLDKESFNITVISLANEGDVSSEVELNKNDTTKFYKIRENKKLDFNSIKEIAKLIDMHHIDILSCHGPKADFYGFLLRYFYKCNMKLVTICHGWGALGFKMTLYNILDKLIMRYFDKIVLVSAPLRREIKGFPIPYKKTMVIYNGIDLNKLENSRTGDLLRDTFSLNKEDFVIGFIGRLSMEKDPETSLRAVAEASKVKKNIKFLIVGDGPLKAKLIKMAQDLDIDNKVIFAGYQKDTYSIYGILNLYISTSIKEALSNSILEAQAAAVPCIVTNISGNREIVLDGVNGYLVPPKDYKTFSQRIIALAEDADLVRRFGEKSREIVKNKFSISERIRKFENMYHELSAS